MHRTTVVINQARLEAEIAADPLHRALGLMFRRSLEPDSGISYVFARPKIHSFWMSHTLVALSVAFLDPSGRILNVKDMEPLDEEHFHLSAGPALFGLEVLRGWFSDRGIGPGDRCE